MTDRSLNECRILVVEDEYLLADDLAGTLVNEGATILGPVPSVKRALALLDGQSPPDGAILDLNLGGESAFPLADALIGRGIPLVFTTGYDASAIPERFADVTRCEKPINLGHIVAALGRVLHA